MTTPRFRLSDRAVVVLYRLAGLLLLGVVAGLIAAGLIRHF